MILSRPPVDRTRRERVVRFALAALVAVEFILLAVSIPDHYIHLDEAWIGEQAHALAHDGSVRSELFDGFAGNGERIVVYHRLFVLAGAAMIDLFGWGIGALRVVPLACGLVLLGLVAFYVRRVRRASTEQALGAIALVLIVPLDFEYVKVYRPEMMAAMFGLAGMLLLHRRGPATPWWMHAAAGAGAGLATLAHPYGAVYAVAGFAWLLLARRWGGAALFALAGVAVLIPAALDVAAHYDLFREQLSNPLVAEKTTLSPMSPLVNLAKEHQRLFRNSRTIPISALFVLSIAAWIPRRRVEPRPDIAYTLLLVAAVGAIVQDKVDRYGILLFPFFAIVVASFVHAIATGAIASKVVRATGALLVVLLAATGLAFQARTAFTEKARVAELNAAVARAMPEGSSAVVPMSFIFDEIDRYDLAATKLAAIRCGGAPTAACVLELMRERDADFFVVTRHGTEEESIRDGAQLRILDSALATVAATADYRIWRRREY